MISVWRAEDSRGHGIYWGNTPFGGSYMGTAAEAVKNRTGRRFGVGRGIHPLPDTDIGREWSYRADSCDFYFGFESLEKAREWLYDDDVNAELTSLGIEVVRYEVDEEDVLFGKAQVAFRRGNATLVERLPMSCLRQPAQPSLAAEFALQRSRDCA